MPTQYADFNSRRIELLAVRISVRSPFLAAERFPVFHPFDGKFGQLDFCRRGNHLFEDDFDRPVVHGRNITLRADSLVVPQKEPLPSCEK